MNSAKIEPKTIITQQVEFDELTINSVNYSPIERVCYVTCNNAALSVQFNGDEYDALGAWTDKSLLQAVITKLDCTLTKEAAAAMEAVETVAVKQ